MQIRFDLFQNTLDNLNYISTQVADPSIIFGIERLIDRLLNAIVSFDYKVGLVASTEDDTILDDCLEFISIVPKTIQQYQ